MGRTRTVAFLLKAGTLGYWDERSKQWTVENDAVQMSSGGSSADVQVMKSVRVVE